MRRPLSRRFMFRSMGRPEGLVVGLVYELLGSSGGGADAAPIDADAEYEPVETLEALEAAFRAIGHRPTRLGRPHDLLKGEPAIDVALSIAEGFGTRNREAWAPVLLEMMGIPRLGSDALSLSLSLDKALTRTVVSAAGVAVAPGAVLRHPDDAARWSGPYPAFVKPRFEGSSKGISTSSRAENENELRKEAARTLEHYRQDALVEAFLPGPEYTVCVRGHAPPRAAPVLQRALDPATGIGHHALQRPAAGAPSSAPGTPSAAGVLTDALEERLQRDALRAFQALECLDFARVDFKLDAAGTPMFLEINTLPTFAPDGSFAILAELEGRSYADYLGEVFAEALARLDFDPQAEGDPR